MRATGDVGDTGAGSPLIVMFGIGDLGGSTGGNLKARSIVPVRRERCEPPVLDLRDVGRSRSRLSPSTSSFSSSSSGREGWIGGAGAAATGAAFADTGGGGDVGREGVREGRGG